MHERRRTGADRVNPSARRPGLDESGAGLARGARRRRRGVLVGPTQEKCRRCEGSRRYRAGGHRNAAGERIAESGDRGADGSAREPGASSGSARGAAFGLGRELQIRLGVRTPRDVARRSACPPHCRTVSRLLGVRGGSGATAKVASTAELQSFRINLLPSSCPVGIKLPLCQSLVAASRRGFPGFSRRIARPAGLTEGVALQFAWSDPANCTPDGTRGFKPAGRAG